jgi:nicotinate-nucleotide adenylyltransferase
MRLGILGGSFDPPHLGHLIIAQEAAAHLGLARVLFVPTRIQPLKQGRPTTPAADRVAMVERAIADNPLFALSRADVDHPGPSYTVDLLARLRAESGPADLFWFIVGQDALTTLLAWRDPAGILARTRLAIAPRPDVAVDWAPLDAALPTLRQQIDWLPGPLIAISATDLRARVAAGRPIRYQVPAGVEAYIGEHQLYK